MPLYGSEATSIQPGDNGYFFGNIIPPPYGPGNTEASESLIQGTKSRTVVVAPQIAWGGGKTQRSITWETTVGGAPTVVLTLQGAMRDVEAEYANVDSSSSGTGEVRQTTPQMFEFWRVVCTTVTGGTAPTLIAKMRCM